MNAIDVLCDYYYPRAKWLQKHCNWGFQSYTGEAANKEINDPLMQRIEIYDCYTRNAAGFSNVLQDLFYGTDTPKWHHMSEERQIIVNDGNGVQKDLAAWLYAFMVHRITGSGASFEWDHGYRNSLVQHWGKLQTVEQMMGSLMIKKDSGQPMFTSIGNQPPAPRKGVSNYDFMIKELPMLITRLAMWLYANDGVGHKDVVDWLNDYNVSQGHRRFNFQYAAFSMDCSDYFPNLVDPDSHTYFGNNAKRCAKLVAPGMKHDDLMDLLRERTGGKPKDLEDVLCDFVRFAQNYVPKEQRGEHAGLTNNSGWESGFEQRNGE